MITLDGSTGEGGGQILRTSLALSMITGQPFHIHHIRAKRPKPGLMRQHLVCVQAAAQICNAQVDGAQLNATAFTFTPATVKAGAYRFEISSAGSCMLVLQTILPALLLSDKPSSIFLSGGTHNPMAPCFDFIEQCFAPILRQMGVGVQMKLRKHGFYPAGGGQVEVEITPAITLQPFELTVRGDLTSSSVDCVIAAIPASVANRQLKLISEQADFRGDQLRTKVLSHREGPGNALIATLRYEHITELIAHYGERALSSEQVVQRVVSDLRAYQISGAPVGPHLADQLMIPMAIAKGGKFNTTEITEHTRTNAQVIEMFLPVKFSIQSNDSYHSVSIASI